MTKLMEWLLAGTVVIIIWISLLTGKSDSEIQWYQKWFPFILVSILGLYSIIVVMYRVFTFNNCENDALELHKEIIEAKADLKAKGIKLKE